MIWEGIESAVVAAHAVAIQSQSHPALVAHQTLCCGVDLEETVRAVKGASSGAIGPYGVENHQLGDTGRAYSRELAFPHFPEWRNVHTGTEQTSSGRFLLDILGGGASTGLSDGRHFGGSGREIGEVPRNMCREILSEHALVPIRGRTRRSIHHIRSPRPSSTFDSVEISSLGILIGACGASQEIQFPDPRITPGIVSGPDTQEPYRIRQLGRLIGISFHFIGFKPAKGRFAERRWNKKRKRKCVHPVTPHVREKPTFQRGRVWSQSTAIGNLWT